MNRAVGILMAAALASRAPPTSSAASWRVAASTLRRDGLESMMDVPRFAWIDVSIWWRGNHAK
jgi:Tfp pilus assembly protein PilV